MATNPTTTGAEGTDLVHLTPEQRAEQALKFTETLDRLRALAGESATIVRVDTADNLHAAKAAKAKLQSTRVKIEKVGKAARDDANKFSKAVIAKERELISVIRPEEDRLQELIEAERLRQEEAERAAREAEQRRAEQIRQAFERIRSLPGLAAQLGVAEIDELIAEAEKLRDDQSHLPEDLRAAARYEANVAIAGCKAARDRRLQADRDAAELEELRRERAERLAREERARANAVEAQRAQAQVQANAAAADDDLPSAIEPAPRRVPAASMQQAFTPADAVPLACVAPLVRAARAVLELLKAHGLAGEPAALDLADALEEAGR